MFITRHIPNAITSLNLLSGCFALLSATQADYKTAFLCIIASAVFDFFDGFSARLLKAYSPIGKELDSLADMVSFGLAPAIILYSFLSESCHCIGSYLPLAIAVFSGLRLAKFNVDSRQSENFIGLATPSCALLCGALIYASQVYLPVELFLRSHPYILPMLSVVLSWLLVCEIPMFSFKFKTLGWKDNANRFLFLGISGILGIVTLIIGLNWSVWVLSIFVTYILVNIIFALMGRE